MGNCFPRSINDWIYITDIVDWLVKCRVCYNQWFFNGIISDWLLLCYKYASNWLIFRVRSPTNWIPRPCRLQKPASSCTGCLCCSWWHPAPGSIPPLLAEVSLQCGGWWSSGFGLASSIPFSRHHWKPKSINVKLEMLAQFLYTSVFLLISKPLENLQISSPKVGETKKL